jgi:hypothetical protein
LNVIILENAMNKTLDLLLEGGADLSKTLEKGI